MSAARDYTPLSAILLNCDWRLDFLFFGKDETQTYDFPANSTFELRLAPAGVAKPAAGAVVAVSSTDFITFPSLNVVSISVPQASLEDWAPTTYDVQLWRTGPGTVAEALYVGSISIFTGLSQVAANGGGGKLGRFPGQPGAVGVFRDPDQVRVVRGDAGGSASAAFAAWQAIDPVVASVTARVVVIPAGQARDVFVANVTPQVRWLHNRGGGDATIAVDAVATGAATEISLPAGESYRPPYRSGLRVSVFSAAGTTIEGEEAE